MAIGIDSDHHNQDQRYTTKFGKAGPTKAERDAHLIDSDHHNQDQRYTAELDKAGPTKAERDAHLTDPDHLSQDRRYAARFDAADFGRFHPMTSPVDVFLTEPLLTKVSLARPCDPRNPRLARPFSAGGRIPRIAWTRKYHLTKWLKKGYRVLQALLAWISKRNDRKGLSSAASSSDWRLEQ